MSILDYMSTKTVKSEPLTDINDIRVPDKIENYIIKKNTTIYKSETSVIYPCINLKNNAECVIKIMCEYNEKIIDLLYEKGAQSDYIVKILAKGYISGGGWYQVFPMYKEGNIAQYIHNMSEKDIMKMLHDLNEALNYLHSEIEIVHMDVKPENIFITDIGTYVLGDYDAARTMGSIIREDDYGFTKEYQPNDWNDENKYTSSLDYAILGKVIQKIAECNNNLSGPGIRNIIKGLTNPINNRWGYKEVNEVCSGHYIAAEHNTKAQKLTQQPKTTYLLVGFDENDHPIYAKSLKDLGMMFRQYSEIVLRRYIKNKNAWVILINFISQHSEKKAILVKNILNDESKKDIESLDEISRILLPYENHLYYKGKMYADFESVLDDVPSTKFDIELINFVKNSPFKNYLSEVGNEGYKTIFEKIESMKNLNEETIYYLILYNFKRDCSFEREILGSEADAYSRDMLMTKIREVLCADVAMFKKYVPKLEAWLIIQGYMEEINKIMEVSLKYEQ